MGVRTALWVAIFTAGVVGCSELKRGMESNRKPVTLPGQAPTELVGGEVPPATPPNSAGSPATPPAVAPNVAGAPAAATPSAGTTGIIGKTTARIVDRTKATAENPALVEVGGSLQGGDPVSLAASAYIDLRGRASTLGLQNDLKLFRGEHDRNPTYDELVAMMKTHNVSFTELPPYQVYAYDSKAGTICILEDKDEKARRYKAAGIPLE